jgi:hypothetical protein
MYAADRPLVVAPEHTSTVNGQKRNTVSKMAPVD